MIDASDDLTDDAVEEFDLSPTTDVTQPEIEVDDRAGTVPRCTRCGREVKTGGEAARPSYEAMAENAADACYRSMGGSWRWCSGRIPFQLTIEG